MRTEEILEGPKYVCIGANLHESVSVNGDKALGPIGAHFSPPASVCSDDRLEHLCPFLKSYEKRRMPAHQAPIS